MRLRSDVCLHSTSSMFFVTPSKFDAMNPSGLTTTFLVISWFSSRSSHCIFRCSVAIPICTRMFSDKSSGSCSPIFSRYKASHCWPTVSQSCLSSLYNKRLASDPPMCSFLLYVFSCVGKDITFVIVPPMSILYYFCSTLDSFILCNE